MIHHGKRDKQIKQERAEREARKREIEQEKETQVHAPEEKTTKVRKRPMVETTQNHLKINKKKTKNQQSKK